MLEQTKYYQEIKKEKKEFDFVGYRALIIGTLYTSRLYDSFHKFKTEGIINVFVSNMKKQIAHLPQNSKLHQTLTMSTAKKEIYNIQSEETMCWKTLKLLANNGLIKFSEKEKTFSTFSKSKLTKQQNNIIAAVDRMYALKDNKLREMIFDCSEEILSTENKVLYKKKSSNEILKREEIDLFLTKMKENNQDLKRLKSPVCSSKSCFFDDDEDYEEREDSFENPGFENPNDEIYD